MKVKQLVKIMEKDQAIKIIHVSKDCKHNNVEGGPCSHVNCWYCYDEFESENCDECECYVACENCEHYELEETVRTCYDGDVKNVPLRFGDCDIEKIKLGFWKENTTVRRNKTVEVDKNRMTISIKQEDGR